MNPTLEYSRAREQFTWCLEDHPSLDADWLRLIGTGDTYCEMLLLEAELLEAKEGLA